MAIRFHSCSKQPYSNQVFGKATFFGCLVVFSRHNMWLVKYAVWRKILMSCGHCLYWSWTAICQHLGWSSYVSVVGSYRLGGGFKCCLISTPTWRRCPIWLIFLDGLKPPTSIGCFFAVNVCFCWQPESSCVFIRRGQRERERGLLITYHEVALILIDKTVSEQILLEVQTNGVGSTLEFKFPREIGEVTFWPTLILRKMAKLGVWISLPSSPLQGFKTIGW